MPVGRDIWGGDAVRLCGFRLASSRQEMCDGIRLPHNGYSEQSIQFMDKVLEISGLGDETFLPDGESSCSCYAAVHCLLRCRSII